MNVHHKIYERIGHENVKRDLITLCHCCHAALHRIQLNTEREYKAFQASNLKIAAYFRLRQKVTDLLVIELWIRDKSNGGDLIIWEQIDRLTGIVKHLYPFLSPARKQIKKRLYMVRDVKICELYARTKSPARTAKQMYMSDVKDILTAYGFSRIK